MTLLYCRNGTICIVQLNEFELARKWLICHLYVYFKVKSIQSIMQYGQS